MINSKNRNFWIWVCWVIPWSLMVGMIAYFICDIVGYGDDSHKAKKAAVPVSNIVNLDSVQRIRANYLIDNGAIKYMVYNFKDSTTVIIVTKTGKQVELKTSKFDYPERSQKGIN